MSSYRLLLPIVSALIAPLACSAQTASKPPAKASTAAPAQPATSSAASNTSKSSPEANAQKQRDATIAAMQGSVEKQKAAVAAAIAASMGKQGVSLAGKDSFFVLAPLPPPPPPVVVPGSQASMPDVNCNPVPEESVAPIVLGASQRESIDPKLVTAVIEQESGFRPCAISDKGAQGLMQIMPDTAARFSVKDPFDEKQNIDAGAKYLKELITKYSGNLALALGAYNAGPDTVDQAGGVPNIPETNDYVKAILTKLGMQPPTTQTPTPATAPAPITDPVPPVAPVPAATPQQ